MKFVGLLSTLLLTIPTFVAADEIHPLSACEASAMDQSREMAEKAVGGAHMDLLSIMYVTYDREFSLEYSDHEESLTVIANIVSGTREGQCTLSKPRIMNED